MLLLSVRITKEQKRALLFTHPNLRNWLEDTISKIADRIIVERNQFDLDKELGEYQNRRALNGNDFKKRKCSQETKDKIRNALKGKYTGFHLFPETKEKIGLANKGKIVSKETREKQSKANFGKKRTAEQRENISKAKTGQHYKKRVKP